MPLNPNTLQPLNAAVLSDTLDSLGLMQQAMKAFMRPLDDTLQLIVREPVARGAAARREADRRVPAAVDQ